MESAVMNESKAMRQLDLLIILGVDKIRKNIRHDCIPPKPLASNFWLWLYVKFGIDTPWHQNAWEKFCRSTQKMLDRDNHVWMWEKSVLKNM